MKKQKLIYKTIFLTLTLSLFSCASAKKEEKAGESPEENKELLTTENKNENLIIEVENSNSEEKKNATNKFESSSTKLWDDKSWSDDSSVYLKTNGDSDIISFVSTGSGNKMLSTKVDFNKQKEYALLVSTAKEGKTFDLSESVLKIRIYIPAQFTNKSQESLLRFEAYYGEGNKYKTDFFNGLQAFHFSDIGHGWQTIKLDFKNGKFDLGQKRGTFSLFDQAVKKSRLVGINIHALEGSSARGNILVDWVSVEESK